MVRHYLTFHLLLTLPFFFAANTVGLALSYYKRDISRLYAADMIGAGLGSLSILVLLFLFYPTLILQIISSIGFLAALLPSYELGLKPKKSSMGVEMIYDEIKHAYERKLFIANDFDVYRLKRDGSLEKV